jgi:hypothetical protein
VSSAFCMLLCLRVLCALCGEKASRPECMSQCIFHHREHRGHREKNTVKPNMALLPDRYRGRQSLALSRPRWRHCLWSDPPRSYPSYVSNSTIRIDCQWSPSDLVKSGNTPIKATPDSNARPSGSDEEIHFSFLSQTWK